MIMDFLIRVIILVLLSSTGELCELEWPSSCTDQKKIETRSFTCNPDGFSLSVGENNSYVRVNVFCPPHCSPSPKDDVSMATLSLELQL